MTARQLPPTEVLLAHRAAGMSDDEISRHYGLHTGAVGQVLRRAGHGKGEGDHRKLPDLETLLKHRADGESDAAIGRRYNVERTTVSSLMRTYGHGRGVRQVLPEARQLLAEVQRDGAAAVAERYGAKDRNTVFSALSKARRRGEIPPVEPKTAVEKQPPAPRPARKRAQPKPKPAAKPAPKPAPVRDWTEPPPDRCRAREMFGTRVCALPPHDAKTRHDGDGPNDPRGTFWGAA